MNNRHRPPAQGRTGAEHFSDVSVSQRHSLCPFMCRRVSSSANPSNPAPLGQWSAQVLWAQSRACSKSHCDFQSMEESRLGRWPWPGHCGAKGMLCRTVQFVKSSLHLLGLEETGLVEARWFPHLLSVNQRRLPPGLGASSPLCCFSSEVTAFKLCFCSSWRIFLFWGEVFCFLIFVFFNVSYITYQF